MSKPAEIDVVDIHVGGDVHRIVLGGIGEVPGDTVYAKMNYLKTQADGLRRLLLHEPRGGHPSLFADLVVTPSHPEADAGFVIMEVMGYPLISGTNTISTAIALLETGRLHMREGSTTLRLEAPGALIEVEARCERGKVRSIEYEAQIPSFLFASGLVVELPNRGAVKFDVVWSGSFYPIVDAEALGFDLVPEEEGRLVAFGKDFITEARRCCHPMHPVFGDEGPLSFVVFARKPVRSRRDAFERRICCYEYPRDSVCRSPAGTPTTAAVVQMVEDGIAASGASVRTISVFDTDLHATISEIAPYNGLQGVKVAIRGAGWMLTRSQIIVDFDDPLTPQQGLRDILLRQALP